MSIEAARGPRARDGAMVVAAHSTTTPSLLGEQIQARSAGRAARPGADANADGQGQSVELPGANHEPLADESRRVCAGCRALRGHVKRGELVVFFCPEV